MLQPLWSHHDKLQAPRKRWYSTRDLGCMNRHKPVHLSPHSFGTFLSQRGAITHAQHPGMGLVLFRKTLWPAVRLGSCFWKYIPWKFRRGDKPFCSFCFLHRHHLIFGYCKQMWLWIGKETAQVSLVSIHLFLSDLIKHLQPFRALGQRVSTKLWIVQEKSDWKILIILQVIGWAGEQYSHGNSFPQNDT